MSLCGWLVWDEKDKEFDVILRKEWSRYYRTVQPQHKVDVSRYRLLTTLFKRKNWKTTRCRINALRLRRGDAIIPAC